MIHALDFVGFTVRVLVIDKLPFGFVGLVNRGYSDVIEGLPNNTMKMLAGGIFFSHVALV